MDGMRLLGIALLGLAPVLAIVALGIRGAGNAGRPLNGVEYARVKDAAALHRWAANRLALLAGAALLLGAAACLAPRFALALVGLFAVIACVVGTWIALGAERFVDPR